jgi:hypothetical protein
MQEQEQQQQQQQQQKHKRRRCVGELWKMKRMIGWRVGGKGGSEMKRQRD